MEGRKPLNMHHGPLQGEKPRPLAVEGPDGGRLTLVSLPPPDTRRWVARRKAEVLAAIRGGLLTAAEACARWHLSPEELELWQQALERAGVPGLRVTRIQIYRDLERCPGRPRYNRQQGHTGIDVWKNLGEHDNEQ